MNTNLSRAVDDVEIKKFPRDNQKQIGATLVAASESRKHLRLLGVLSKRSSPVNLNI
jgi:hypothetical protein